MSAVERKKREKCRYLHGRVFTTAELVENSGEIENDMRTKWDMGNTARKKRRSEHDMKIYVHARTRTGTKIQGKEKIKREASEKSEQRRRRKKKGEETYGTCIGLLLLPHRHLAVVEQPADSVVERQQLVVERLPQDVGVVLQAHALLAHRLVRRAAVVAHLCAELGAGGLEEVCFLL